MKKLSILSLVVVFMLASITSAFCDVKNSPNASNARVTRGLAPERQAIRSITNTVKNDIQNAKNYIGEKSESVERTAAQIKNSYDAVTTKVNNENTIERTANEIKANVKHEYNSFNENFNEVVKDKVVTLKSRFNNTIKNVSRSVHEKVHPIGSSIGNTIQNTGGTIILHVNDALTRY
ncbi:MAG TPA: hypothetical protein PKK26_09710 [Candidatus Wallbacteria bacterium]|nr:hypothetical protein [Candidatus Wallbacteria bacterium]